MASAEAAGSADTTTSFSASVLAHLKQIHESLRQNGPEPDFGSVQDDAIVPQETDKLGSKNENLASFGGFLNYMASPVARAHRDAENSDLSSQIAHYYISSSHNTYLTGNQLYSEASAAAYTNVLLRGCRCLEIDVWDGLSRSSSISNSSPSSSSSSSQSESGKEKKQPPSQNPKGHSRMKSLSDGVRQIVKRAASTRSRKRPDTLRTQVLKENTPSTAEDYDPLAVREPRVLHGHTLTKEVSFRDVCYAIRDNAFVASDLPVIVSLEVHADLNQQQMMVDIMREAWKDYLVEIDSGEEADLPRLEDLRNKILIKVKWSPPSKAAEEAEETEEKIEEAEAGLKNLDVAAGENTDPQKKQKKSKILHTLSELAVYTRAYHFSHFTQKEAAMPTHVFSLSEAAVKDAHENNRQALLNHNRDFLMRVYPSGIRLNSSNLNPIFFWQQGAQMVALNWQNCDKGMMINDAMFPNGVGWVKKPSVYRNIANNADSCSNALPNGTIQTLDLSIDIYAGQNIRNLTGNSASGKGFRPYIICQLHLCKADDILTDAAEVDKNSKEASANEKSSKKYKLRTKTSTGNDPDFQAEKMEFPRAERILQDMSFIRFKIKDNEFGRRDSLAAWACIRLDRLKQGYRLVHLKDHLGQPSAGALLVKINKRVSDS